MSFVAADWSLDRQTGNIRYIGHDHNGASPSYATNIEFHRAIQDFADDAGYTGNDELDITDLTPSERSTDNIITLINGWNIDDTAAEHLYDGSIIQDSGNVIYDGFKVLAPIGTAVQIIQNGAVLSDDWWNYSEGGSHTGAANAAVLTDGTKSWTVNQWAGYRIKNITDGSYAVIVSNTATTITGTLAGGTDNDWDAADVYLIQDGLNGDSANGVSHNFMLKVRTAGADVDGRRLIATTREWGKVYNEFKINGSTRGINVVALATASDLNNATAIGTIAALTGITNTSTGYKGIDVNNDTTDEYFYSEWNLNGEDVNDFYERMKWLTRDGYTTTLYGLAGELFRGITHDITVDGQGGTDFLATEPVSWSGGTGQMLAINDTNAATRMWIQLLTGVAPTDNQTITGTTSTATCLVNVTVTERTISVPFIGASTGSSIIGAYGVGIEYLDLSSTDKVFDLLTNTLYQAPNNVTFTVAGLVSGDRVLVTNDDTGIDYNQLLLSGTLSGAAVTAVVVSTAIPVDTPNAGTIRIERNDGQYTRHAYTSWTGSTFTIGSTDFSTNNATSGNDVFISYIDEAAAGATLTFTGVYASDRTLFIRVRDGGGTPIKTFETTGTLSSSGGSTTAIRTSDS